MRRVKSDGVACLIVFGLIFSLPLFGCAQNNKNIVDRKPVVVANAQNEAVKKPMTVATAEISKQTIKQEAPPVKEETKSDGQKEENGFFNFNSNSSLAQQNTDNEEKQDMMEDALELLEKADKLWKKGDIEETLNTLDEAYSILLDANGDVTISQEKDNLRLLISRRILAVYSSQQTRTNGKASEIRHLMNADVEKEIRSFQGPEREFFISSYQRSGMYREIILRELRKAGVPEGLSWLPLVESGFKTSALSQARALGLWQFIPSAGYKFGLSRDEWIDERMDVQKSTQAAIAYLKELHSMFNDWPTVLAAYNCGEGIVLRVISRQHINYFDHFGDLYRQLPNETARHVPRFIATLHIVNNPQKYGFDLKNVGKPIAFETVKVNKIMKLKDIAEKIEVSEEVLCLLNPELRHKMTPDRVYNLKLPEKSLDKFNLVYTDIPQSEKPRFISARTKTAGRMVFIKHRVKRGETVTSIAKKYNVSSSVIKSCNRIKKYSKLFRGQILKIPTSKKRHTRVNEKKNSPVSSGRYKVKRGDTLLIIASRYGMTLNKIRQLNNLKTNEIYVGQVLKIPKNR
jgi:membrane-bound lytic murein transglycosylase D